MKRVLYLYRDSPFARFIQDDRAILRERYIVDDLRLTTHPKTLAKLALAAARADLVYVWWGDLTGLLGAALAKARGKPVVLVTGGYDVADVPSIRYGLRYHPWRKHLPPIVLSLADAIIANAAVSRDQVITDYAVDAGRVTHVPHGLDASALTPGEVTKERRVFTCSLLSVEYIKYKGLDTFVAAARSFPDVPFVHGGPVVEPAALEQLKREAPPNVQFLGFLEDDQLLHEMRRAVVYAQLSAHEGFGIALAEAMLAGATPVVSRAGAIPEVVGDCGEYAAYGDVAGVVQAIERALASPRGERARARIATSFSLAQRRAGVLGITSRILGE